MNIRVVMAAITDDVASNLKHHGLTQLFRRRVQIVLNRDTVQAESQGTRSNVPSATEHSRLVPRRGQCFWSVRSVAAVVPPTPPHGRKLQVGEVSVRVPLDRPCENAGLSIPGRPLNG